MSLMPIEGGFFFSEILISSHLIVSLTKRVDGFVCIVKPFYNK